MSRHLEKRRSLSNGSICVLGLTCDGTEESIGHMLQSILAIKHSLKTNLYITSYPFALQAATINGGTSVFFGNEAFWNISEFNQDLLTELSNPKHEEIAFVLTKGEPNRYTNKSFRSVVAEFFANDPLYKIKALPENMDCICFIYSPPHRDLEIFFRRHDEDTVRKFLETN